MTINNDYEVSSEGAVRHWEIPQARLTNNAPVITEPAELLSVLSGTQLTGTVLTVDNTLDIAVIDFTCSMVYRHNVRNVLTYNAGAENTWGAINIGDPVYYDNSATMPAGTYLSTSPLDNLGTANTRFGRVVNTDFADIATFPHGAAQVGSTHELGVMQVGAGG